VAAGSGDLPVEAGAGSGSARLKRLRVLAAPIDICGRADGRLLMADAVLNSFDRLCHIVTLNPEYVMLARRKLDFQKALDRGDLIVCDGVGTRVAAALIHGRRADRLERVTGVNLLEDLGWLTAHSDDLSLFLLGGMDAPGAADGLRRRIPAARIGGAWSGGGPDPDGDDESLDRIRSSGAQIVVVAYGAPGQVIWIERNRAALERSGVRVAVGIGGALDYLSGHAAPAPALVRRIGLEWAYRLSREPWRWRRQSVLPLFALLAIGETIRERARRLGGDTTRRSAGR
jgi:N-acetylglucosaminyldiphosphoundecaprenol N-acetyl-beta-D-mannosaminyltransferase